MTAFESIPALAATQRHLVSYRQLREAGVGDDALSSLLRRAHLERVIRGVYLLQPGELDYPTVALAHVLGSGGPAWASHHTALALHGLTKSKVGKAGPSPPISVTTTHGHRLRRPDLKGHRGRSMPTSQVTTTDAVPLTSLPRTLADLAATTGPKQLRRWAERALSDRLTTLDELHAGIADLPRGRRGKSTMTALLATLAADQREPGLSELEALARRVLTAADLVPDHWEQHVATAESGWLGRVDALFTAARVVIEFDGRRFHDHRADARRDIDLLRVGFLVLRFGWFDLRDRAPVVVEQIRTALTGRTERPS